MLDCESYRKGRGQKEEEDAYCRVLGEVDAVAGRVLGCTAIALVGQELAFVDAFRKPAFELLVVASSLC
jgi:hypothetical protein